MVEWSDVSSKDWLGHLGSDENQITRSVLDSLMLQAVEPKGKAIVDLGCGEGYFSRLLRDAGAARVVGLDISPELVKEAQNQDPDGEYHVHDIMSGPHAGPFDAVTASLSLMYLSNLDAAYEGISASLRPGGVFVASITNPYYAFPVGQWAWAWTLNDEPHGGQDPRRGSGALFKSRLRRVLHSRFRYELHIDDYFERRTVEKRLTSADVLHVHRPFADYLNLAEKHGLHFRAMWEPQIAPESAARYARDLSARTLASVPLLFVLAFSTSTSPP